MSATVLLATSALAQPVPPAATYVPPYMESDPAEALSRYLRMLATNPRDLASLTGAGKAALDIGDASAALGFYARAEEIDPKNGRIKAGIGSALVQMEQPDTALRFFDDAVRLGVPVPDIAASRGLAYDLRGETRRAQADYQTVLRAGPDAEVRRRLALSQAIGGDRAAAQATLRPLLAERDPAARRVNAFVLALTGDSVGASVAATQAMSGEQAAAMLPYLARLPLLQPAAKAAAVHFGRFPADATPLAPQPGYADATAAAVSSSPGALLTPGGERLGGPVQADTPVRADRTRRRPGREVLPPKAAATAPIPAATAAAPAKPSAPAPALPPIRLAEVAPSQPQVKAPPAASPAPTSPSSRMAGPVMGPPVPDNLALILPQSQPVRTEAPKPVPEAKPRAEVVRKPEPAKPDSAAVKLAARKAEERKAAEKKAADKKAADKKAAAEKKATAPERYWVQVASGANKRDLGKAWNRVRGENKLLAGKTAWTTPWRASNRLLVGPFKSEGEAQGFVNALAKSGMSTMQFTSRGGTNVERLAP